MSDLTLDEISELKEEEIRLRLFEEYNIISYGKDMPEDTGRPETAGLKGIKRSCHKIRTLILKQLKTIRYKGSILPKSIENNP